MTTTFAILGWALLWACFDQEASNYVPSSVVNHVNKAYQQLPTRVLDSENPMKKKQIVISGNEDELHITELDLEDEAGNQRGQQGGGGGGGGPIGRNDVLAVYTKVWSLRHQNKQLTTHVENLEDAFNWGFKILNGNIHQIAR